jgi:hypothetical protein
MSLLLALSVTSRQDSILVAFKPKRTSNRIHEHNGLIQTFIARVPKPVRRPSFHCATAGWQRTASAGTKMLRDATTRQRLAGDEATNRSSRPARPAARGIGRPYCWRTGNLKIILYHRVRRQNVPFFFVPTLCLLALHPAQALVLALALDAGGSLPTLGCLLPVR